MQILHDTIMVIRNASYFSDLYKTGYIVYECRYHYGVLTYLSKKSNRLNSKKAAREFIMSTGYSGRVEYLPNHVGNITRK